MSLTVTAVVNTAILDSLMLNIEHNTDKAVEATSIAIETDVKVNIQAKHIIDTGRLLNSISHDQLEERVWEVTDGVEYGIYQELGTRRGIIARPFFIPAVEKNANTLYENLGNVFK